MNLTSLEKGKIVVRIIDENENLTSTSISDKFFLATGSKRLVKAETLEKYAIEYLDTIVPCEKQKYLEIFANQNIFPTFQCAKSICLSPLNEKEFCKRYKVSSNIYSRALLYATSLNAYSNLKRVAHITSEEKYVFTGKNATVHRTSLFSYTGSYY